jgi:hypothetical protein
MVTGSRVVRQLPNESRPARWLSHSPDVASVKPVGPCGSGCSGLLSTRGRRYWSRNVFSEERDNDALGTRLLRFPALLASPAAVRNRGSNRPDEEALSEVWHLASPANSARRWSGLPTDNVGMVGCDREDCEGGTPRWRG